MVRSGLAGPKAEPGRVAGVRGGRRHPGRTGRRRAARQRHLAGGGGRPRACAGGGRRRRERPAHARTGASSSIAGHPTGCACMRGWLTPGSATPAVITRVAAGPWHPRCGWPNLSSSGSSRWSAAGSSRCCAATPHWPAATAACSPPAGRHEQLPAPRSSPDQAPILVVESLTAREREVLRRLSGLLTSAEIASDLDISIHTVGERTSKTSTASWQPPAAARRSAAPGSLS